MTPSAYEFAKYLLYLAAQEPEAEPITQMRLHKLLYYVEGWSLAVRDRSAFSERIAAWAHGPVVSPLYSRFRDFGNRPIELPDESSSTLEADDRGFVDSVWSHYKQFSPTKLRNMTHSESPWREARGNLDDNATSDTPISRDSIKSYFRALFDSNALEGLAIEDVRSAEKDLSSSRVASLSSVLTRLGIEADEL